MADDKTPASSDADLPAPEDSPFFASDAEPPVPAEPLGASEYTAYPEPVAAETEPVATEPAVEPAAQPAAAEAATAEPAAEPAATEVAATEPAAAEEVDLGATNPYDPLDDEYIDPAAAQFTQHLAPIDPDLLVPPYDPHAAQMTQVMPVVSNGDIEGQPQPALADEPPALAPGIPTVVAGSRVVIVVSRGPAEAAPAALTAAPHVIGMSQGEALSQLQQAGLSAQVFNEYSTLARGEVVGQVPPYGAAVPVGSEAVLLVSSGPAPAATLSVPLPDVVGLSEADGLARLQQAGLSPQTVRDYNVNVPLGVIVAQLPNGHAIAEAPRTKAPRSLWWLWLLLVLAILFAVAGGAYYYLNRTAAVPNLVGQTQAQAEEAIVAAGFKLGSIGWTQTTSATDVGKVMSQTPPPSTQLRLIDQIDLVISGGQKLFPIPDVANMTETDARSTLTSAGLQVATSQAYSTTVPKDSVISQSPAANQKVPGGTTVGITVSLGVQSVSVPGVQSLSRVDAANKLKATNLSSQAVTEYTFSGVTKGLVFAQYPTAGMSVAPGTIVAILVSNGSSISTATPTAAQSATIPSVVGQALKSAQKSLKSAHLGNTIINWSGTGRPTGEVVGQAPEVGTTVPRNVNVVLFVSNGK